MELTNELLWNERVALAHRSHKPAAARTATTVLSTSYVTADTIGVTYKTMPGNQPNSYGNYVAIWQNTNSIPFNAPPPLKRQKIDTNTPDGDMVFSDLDVTNNSYIVGYSVGPELGGGNQQKQGNICATDFIPAIGESDPTSPASRSFSPSLEMLHIGATSIAVQFDLPSGELPQSNGAWIGIWRAGQASHNNPPEAKNDIQVDASSGSAFINDIKIGRGLTYTVALFTSGWCGPNAPSIQMPMACSVTFTNSGRARALGRRG